jgi:hypothetical protein
MSSQLQLSYFLLLGGFSILFGFNIFLRKSWPARWLHLRKKVFLIFFGMWLVSAGCLLASFFQTAPFFKAVKSGNTELVSTLLSQKPSLALARTIAIWQDDTALQLAATTGNNDVVLLLLKAGADVNAADSAGGTPLHEAAFYGNDLVAKTLLKAGANVNAIGYRGKVTPLYLAVGGGHVNMVKILLSNGADINAVDRYGKTALQLAKEDHQTNIVAILSNPSLLKQ